MSGSGLVVYRVIRSGDYWPGGLRVWQDYGLPANPIKIGWPTGPNESVTYTLAPGSLPAYVECYPGQLDLALGSLVDIEGRRLPGAVLRALYVQCTPSEAKRARARYLEIPEAIQRMRASAIRDGLARLESERARKQPSTGWVGHLDTEDLTDGW